MYNHTAPVPHMCMCHMAGQQPMQGQYLTVYSRVGEMQGYALHGHMDLHTWHTHVGSTGTSAQYILPVPWSRDCYYLVLGV